MNTRRRPVVLLPFLLTSLLSLTFASCQQVLGIHDVDLDRVAAPPEGNTSSGTGGRGGGGSGDGGDGSDGGGGNPDVADFSLVVLSPSVAVPLGGRDVIEIEIRRTGGFSGDVTVESASPPVGLVITPVTVPGGQSKAEVVVGGEAPLAIGNTISFTLSATSGALEKTASVMNASVTGRPGSYDETFGTAATGIAAVSYGSDDGGAVTDLEVMGEQIVFTGWGAGGLGGSSFKVARLTSAGVKDPAFADGALLSTRFGSNSGSTSTASAVGHQLDGRIIAIGSHEFPEPPDIALLRVGRDGAVGDALFGNAGKALIDLGGAESVSDGIVLSNNKILVIGQRDEGGMVARATSEGYLDTSFAAPNGYLTLGPAFSPRAVVADRENRILVAGQLSGGSDSEVVVARFLADGQTDRTFGANGQKIIGTPGTNDNAVAIAVLDDDRILVGGDSGKNGNLDFMLIRLLADGSADPTFGTNGIATPPITPGDDSAGHAIVLPDGRFLVVGQAGGSASPGPVIARYTRDGRLDTHFGTRGIVSLYIGDSGVIHHAAVYSGHKVVICGENQGGVPGPGTYAIIARVWM